VVTKGPERKVRAVLGPVQRDP